MNNYTIAIIAIVSSGIAGLIGGSLRGFAKGKKKGEGRLIRELQLTEENSRPNVYTLLECVSRECLEENGALYQLKFKHEIKHYYLDFEIPSYIEKWDEFIVCIKDGRREFRKCNNILAETEGQILAEA